MARSNTNPPQACIDARETLREKLMQSGSEDLAKARDHVRGCDACKKELGLTKVSVDPTGSAKNADRSKPDADTVKGKKDKLPTLTDIGKSGLDALVTTWRGIWGPKDG
jgi:hypothetical protein